MNAPKVFSVVVLYRPDAPKVLGLCASLLADGSPVVLVDNTESPYLSQSQLPAQCKLITLGLNTGIAHAQNVGVRHAMDSGADIVAFFDQDSTVALGFLTALTSPLKPGVPEVVSPLYFDDANQSELPSLRLNKYGLSSAVHREGANTPYPVDVVISSGTAATKEVFAVAGLLDESLFIDFVDTEWCLRCRSKNIPIHVVPSAVMHHRIGSNSIKVGALTVLVHNPIRCYYQLRNCFFLFRRRHVPLVFSIKQLVSVLVSRVLLLFFVKDRFAYMKAYLCALRDGVRGVSGPKPA